MPLALFCECACRYLCFGLLFLFVTLMAADEYALHIHHYFIAFMFMPFFLYNTRLTMVLQSAMLGLMINGIAVWGFASMWIERPEFDPPAVVDVHAVDVSNTTISIAWTPEAALGSAMPIAATATATATAAAAAAATMAADVTMPFAQEVYGVAMNNVEVAMSAGIAGYTATDLLPATDYFFCVVRVLQGIRSKCEPIVVKTLSA